ncbi:stage V sporulation protein D [Clostridium sp.]|uniref:stage V sporulation protein D n=1 Tax=Clostridium sp. TaxID=1506 RepID=UPI002673A295|nr:stage V sporulation protein D [Clostridium sp.]MCI7029341.1 stage V sporulation protein D [Clostridium sp.]
MNKVKKKKKKKLQPFDLKKINAQSIDRLIVVAIAIGSVIGLLLVKMLYLTVIKGPELAEKAETQWKSEMNLTAMRGNIVDRNGSILVTSTNVYRIEVDMDTLKTYIEDEKTTVEKVSSDLAEALGASYDDIYGKLSDEENKFIILSKGLEKDVIDKVKSLEIRGLVYYDEIERYYPNGNYLSQVLGIINSEGVGLTGLELQYDDYLSGLSGIRIGGVDAYSNDLPFVSGKQTNAINGKDIVTTIDENLQYYAELVANEGLETYKAKRVSITIMNPNNGEILAMASTPGYDPNNPYEGYESFEGDTENDKIQNMLRNSIVSDTYEPGSTFKIITMAAAMEEGLIHDDDVFVCNGSKKFGDVHVHCWNLSGHGEQTAAEILKNSCNVGFMELGARLGAEKLNEYIKKLGFGNITGIDLPGEAEGIVKSTNSISDIDLATIVFGQTNTLNALQLLTAFNAVANGGNLIQPHIVKEITHKDSNGNTIVDKTIEGKTTENVLSEKTSATLREYLERTATQDEGAGTFVQGYDIAGKTGTAEKVDRETGTYSADKYIASMLAMTPVDDPQLTVYIAVDEPSTGVYYGGQVAAPLMKKLFSYIFAYIESPTGKASYSISKDVIIPEVRGKSIEEAKSILEENGLGCEINGDGNTIVSINPYPGTTVKAGSKITLTASSKSSIDNKIIMPDLAGTTVEFAINLLDNLGLQYEYEGSGKVVKQSISSGELISRGTKVKLVFKEESEY